MANLEGEWLHCNGRRDHPFASTPEPASNTTEYDKRRVVVDGALFVADANNAEDVVGFVQIDLNDNAATARNFTKSADIDFQLQAAQQSDGYKTMYGWSNDSAYYLYLIVPDSDIGAITWNAVEGQAPELTSRASHICAGRVDSIALRSGGISVSLGEVCRLTEGNNINLELDPDSARLQAVALLEPGSRPPAHRIVLNAVAGAGDGRIAAGCGEPSVGFTTINKQGPADGNFQLTGDGCYRIARPGGTVDETEYTSDAHTLEIANDCQACCECSEFSDLLEGIRNLKNEGIAIREILDNARDAFREVTELWQSKLACVGTNCVAQIFCFSYAGWLATVQIWIGNPQNCLKVGSKVEVSFSGGTYDPVYVPGSGQLYNDQNLYSQVDPIRSGGTFVMEDNTSIKGGGYKIFSFSVLFQQSASREDGAVVNVSADVTMCGQTKESLGASVVLRANLNRT